jgi:hypothetical protein
MQSARFDYTNQAWLRDSGDGLRYTRCGHPDSMNCDCFGKAFEGFTQEEAAEILSQARQLGRSSAQIINSQSQSEQAQQEANQAYGFKFTRGQR